MKDISNKIETFRTARASALVRLKPESIRAIKENLTPKKDVIPTARAAGLLAVKNTSNVIPHCHPIPVDSVTIEFEFGDSQIHILVEVKSIHKTGCEMEALYGASVTALTIYDMLKPIDKQIKIEMIKLESKSGGKSDFTEEVPKNLRAAVIVVSDSISSGKGKDKAGITIKEKLESYGIEVSDYVTISDEAEEITNQVKKLCSEGIEIIITTGGTGLSQRDNTPEAIKPLIEKEIPGIMETARSFGQKRMPYAMLSRGIAGLIGRSLILTLPGSERGAGETIDALFPFVLHIQKVLERGYRHNDGDR